MGSSTRLCATGKPAIRWWSWALPVHRRKFPPARPSCCSAAASQCRTVFYRKALRAAGNKVIYFAGYKYKQDVFKVEDIEAASDVIIWSVDKGPALNPSQPRVQDKNLRRQYSGNHARLCNQ